MTDSLPRGTDKGYRRLSPLTPVVRAPLLLLAFLGASWQQLLDQEDLTTTGLVFMALLAAGAVYGFASWVRTKYWIDGDELRIDKGVLVRQSRRIRIDRLQGIDIVQPLLARVFGLAELRFDVASGNDREGALAFLPHNEALALRSLLLERRDDLRSSTAAPPAPPGWPTVPAQPALPAQPVPERELARLDLGLLLGSLLLSTETLLLGGAAVFLGALFLLTGSFALGGGVVPALAGLAFTLGKKLTAYYGFTVAHSPAGLHVRRGLTALSSQTIALVRVQGLVVSEPLLWRPFGWAKLEVSVAGYQVSDSDLAQASSTLMPVAAREEVFGLVRHVLGGREVTAVPVSAPPRRARWLAPLTSWAMALGQDRDLLVSRRGFWVRRLDVVPQERVQSVRISQGPTQRRLGLADVHIDSPPGPVTVRGEQRHAGQAREFSRRAVELGRAARRGEGRSQPSDGLTRPAPETTQ